MPDRMRWRYGDTNPVMAEVDADTVVEIGDLVWLDRDDAKPASRLSLRVTLAQRFLGVAMQRSRAGETGSIRVATTGVFEFECREALWELGDLVGAAVDPDTIEGLDPRTARLANQVVDAVPMGLEAIGRVAKRYPLHTATVLVDVCSTIMRGGVR
jgi:hypothetical protein